MTSRRDYNLLARPPNSRTLATEFTEHTVVGVCRDGWDVEIGLERAPLIDLLVWSVSSVAVPLNRGPWPRLATLPSDVDAVAGPERVAQDFEEVVGGAAVADDVDRRSIDVVVAILARLFFERVLQDSQVRLGNRADELIRLVVVQINHDRLSCALRATGPEVAVEVPGPCRVCAM